MSQSKKKINTTCKNVNGCVETNQSSLDNHPDGSRAEVHRCQKSRFSAKTALYCRLVTFYPTAASCHAVLHRSISRSFNHLMSEELFCPGFYGTKCVCVCVCMFISLSLSLFGTDQVPVILCTKSR